MVLERVRPCTMHCVVRATGRYVHDVVCSGAPMGRYSPRVGGRELKDGGGRLAGVEGEVRRWRGSCMSLQRSHREKQRWIDR